MQHLALKTNFPSFQRTGLVEDIRFNHPSPSEAALSERLWEPPIAVGEQAEGRPTWLACADRMTELTLNFDPKRRILWQFMRPEERPSFTPGLLKEMTTALDAVETAFSLTPSDRESPVRYVVLGSSMPGIFNLGGDLPLFISLIEQRNRDGLLWYARTCANGQYRRAVDLKLPICTISVVQGDALGGGFEAALAHDVIISERGAKFGLPEILFNMFPGMGACSFLSRRLNPAQAERIILSGKVYTAEEMHELGVVDELVDDGYGIDAVQDYVDRFERSSRARTALLQARRMVNPLCRKELMDIATLWVDTALTLDPVDIRRMKHLALAQDRRWARIRPQ